MVIPKNFFQLCALSTGEITSYLNSNEVDETNNSDEDTSANISIDTSSDTMLNHIEEHLKRAINMLTATWPPATQML